MRVLFLTHRLPYAPDRGDRIRAIHILRSLCEYADVDLLSLVHDDDEAAHVNEVTKLGVRVTVARVRRVRNLVRAVVALVGRRPLTHVLLDAPGINATLRKLCDARRFDVVLAFCSGMARFALEPPLSGLPLVLDLVDVDSQKWNDLALRTPPPLKWVYRREAQRLGAFEAMAAARAATTLVVNDREAAVARALSPTANVAVMWQGIDMASYRPTSAPAPTARVIFCGVMDYAPNEDAALWLAQEIWPLVRTARPDAKLTLVGPNPTARLRAACVGDASIEITGRVADVRPHLWDSAVAVAPLRVARGLQNKALEALAAGLPTVITSAVAAGLPPSVLPGCAVADTATGCAARILELLALEPHVRRARAAGADLEQFLWSTTLAPLRAILQAAIDGTRSSQVSKAR
jgi:sugar transferase (PEP-CTERM/EpsH1 system associated)